MPTKKKASGSRTLLDEMETHIKAISVGTLYIKKTYRLSDQNDTHIVATRPTFKGVLKLLTSFRYRRLLLIFIFL